MAGEWLKTQERNEANIQPSWTNKLGQQTIYYMAKKRAFTCGTNAGNPERGKMGPARLANQNAGFASSCRSRIQEYNNKG